jgi:hypothetical protein
MVEDHLILMVYVRFLGVGLVSFILVELADLYALPDILRTLRVLALPLTLSHLALRLVHL